MLMLAIACKGMVSMSMQIRTVRNLGMGLKKSRRNCELDYPLPEQAVQH